MTEKETNYGSLKSFATENGASLFGTADITNIRDSFRSLPENSLNTAVSIAFSLSRAVLEGIEDRPTKLYFSHYKQANYFLDNLALRLANFIQDAGYDALPVPASQVIDREKQAGHLSHRQIASLAGIGWIGRSNLLVTEKFGAGVRLATILTDFPLSIDDPAGGSCGECTRCLQACPAGAIREDIEGFDKDACFRQLDSFRKTCQIGHHICGVCVRACPYGRG